MANGQKRTQYIVYRYVRFYYLSVWLLSILFILLVGAMFLFYREMGSGRTLDLSSPAGFYTYLGVVGVVFFLIFFAIAIGLHSIVNSHRIAGAAYAIRGGLTRALGKDFSRKVNLREKDFLKELAEPLNDLLDRGQRQEDARKEVLAEVSSLRDLLGKNGSPDRSLVEAVQRVESKLQSL